MLLQLISVSKVKAVPLFQLISPWTKWSPVRRLKMNETFKCILVNEKFGILIQISTKFVSKGVIDEKSAFVQVMAWCWTGDKPLPEPMLTQYTDSYMRHKDIMKRMETGRPLVVIVCMNIVVFWFIFHWKSLPKVQWTIAQHFVQTMNWHQTGYKPLSESMMV